MFLNLFQPDWAEAIGWTLLHSLWQGTLIFVLTLPLLVLFKRHTPRLRYNILCLALFALPGSMAITFYHYMPDTSLPATWVSMENSTPASETVSQSDHTAATSVLTNTPVLSYSVKASVQSFIRHYAVYLVNIWLIGACFFAFRWLGGLIHTQRLKTNGIISPGAGWQQKVEQWTVEMGIRKKVRLLESIKTEVPIILGHFKPIILLPIGTLSGLTPKQVEVIILHELAHVRRHDFVTNLIIAALEMILFYHPLYWWLCNQIQQEREQSCDDIAVAVCGNTRLYAKTLLLMEEKRQQKTLAMAYQGKKNHLLDRIKRICVAAPVSYRPEYGKAGLSIALLLTVAVMSWAKMPEKVALAALTIPNIEADGNSALPPAADDEQMTTPEATAEKPSLPHPAKQTQEPAPRLALPSDEAVADTIPYVPDIPAIGIEPQLPAAPKFPYTPEELAEALQNQNNEPGFLAGTMDTYETKLRDWQNSVRKDYLNTWNDRNNLIIEVYQSWKNDLDQYRRKDKIAFLVALKKGIRYFENELKTHEKAVKKAENAVKGDLENYIRSFENMIKTHENQQKDHDSRMAVHDDRMRVHDLRMAVHDGRMDIHDSRMHIHDTRMKFHDERMKAHDVIMEAFEQEFFSTLEADGLGKKSDRQLDFVVENGKVTVNGKVLPVQQAEKYRSLLKKYGFAPPKDGSFFFKISEDNRSIGTSGNYSMSRREE